MITVKIYNTGQYLNFFSAEEANLYIKENGFSSCIQQGQKWIVFQTNIEQDIYFFDRQCISRFVFQELLRPISHTFIYSKEDVQHWKSALTHCFSQFDVFEPNNFIDNQSYSRYLRDLKDTEKQQIFKCVLNAYFHMTCNYGCSQICTGLLKEISCILLSSRIAKGLEYMILQIIFNLQQIFEDNLKSWEGMSNEDSYNFKLHYGEPSFGLFGEDDNGGISFFISSSYGQDHISLMIDSQLLKRIMSFTANPSQYDVQNLVNKLRNEFLKIHMPLLNCEYNIQRIAWDDGILWSGLTIEVNISSFYCPY